MIWLYTNIEHVGSEMFGEVWCYGWIWYILAGICLKKEVAGGYVNVR